MNRLASCRRRTTHSQFTVRILYRSTLDSCLPLWIMQVFHLNLTVAASTLGITPSRLKALSRNQGFKRWPQRKIMSLFNLRASVQEDPGKNPEDRQVGLHFLLCGDTQDLGPKAEPCQLRLLLYETDQPLNRLDFPRNNIPLHADTHTAVQLQRRGLEVGLHQAVCVWTRDWCWF